LSLFLLTTCVIKNVVSHFYGYQAEIPCISFHFSHLQLITRISAKAISLRCQLLLHMKIISPKWRRRFIHIWSLKRLFFFAGWNLFLNKISSLTYFGCGTNQGTTFLYYVLLVCNKRNCQNLPKDIIYNWVPMSWAEPKREESWILCQLTKNQRMIYIN